MYDHLTHSIGMHDRVQHHDQSKQDPQPLNADSDHTPGCRVPVARYVL